MTQVNARIAESPGLTVETGFIIGISQSDEAHFGLAVNLRGVAKNIEGKWHEVSRKGLRDTQPPLAGSAHLILSMRFSYISCCL